MPTPRSPEGAPPCDTLFAQSCPYEEGENCRTATEDETGKRSQLKPLENHSFDHQAHPLGYIVDGALKIELDIKPAI